MSAGHTPGPWSVGPAHAVIGANGKRVCQGAIRHDDHDVDDIFLIASAPELLEALESIAIKAQSLADARQDQGGLWLGCAETARAAIAKATGKGAVS